MSAGGHIRRYSVIFGLIVAAISIAPYIYGRLAAPASSTYIGYQFNTDDHMVYAAWMRQAMDGHLLFDNRFTTDSQPGLTLHFYFLVLGWIAKFLGIGLTTALARAGFGFLFILLLGRLVERLVDDVYSGKLAVSLAALGGGVGFLVWHDFGQAIVKPAPALLSNLMLGRLPTDVWQPEGFAFPSLLTNSLFAVGLCLIMGIFLCVLQARDTAKTILPGAGLFLLLMNIHSYDVVLVAMAMLGLLASSIYQKQFSWQWAGRCALMAAGAIPSALWFLYVLKHDPVFQARAATETFSPNFRQVVFGYLPLVAIGISLFFVQKQDARPRYAAIAMLISILALFLISAEHLKDQYWMGWPAWLAAFAVAATLAAFLSSENPSLNLVISWASIGLIAPYFPALFQRKLLMGLSVPWAILAALAIGAFIRAKEKGARNLSTALAVLILCATSARWFFREREFIQSNVSNTTVHPVFLSSDVRKVVGYLNELSEKKVILAMPGFPSPSQEVDRYQSPYLPDTNPLLTGFTGSYTYAGHWSETPDYAARRAELTRFFLEKTLPEERKALIAKSGANFVLAPVPEAFPLLAQNGLVLADLRSLGTTVLEGSQFRLIRVNPG